MTINNTKTGNKVTISVSGRVDTNTAPELDKAVNGLIKDASLLILDLGGLGYISSSGLRVLLTAQKTMNRQGSMKLVNVNDTIMEILDITGFSDILTIEK